MDLTALITELHENKMLQLELKNKLSDLKSRQENIEKQIKTILDKDKIEYDNLSEEEFQLLLSDMHNPELINVEVVYADPAQQVIKAVQLSPGATIEECIAMSEMLQQVPSIDLGKNKVGIYGAIKTLHDTVQDGDRIEIYRPVESSSAKTSAKV